MPGITSDTTKAINDASANLKSDSSLDEAIKIGKDVSTALGKDKNAKGSPLATTFDQALAALEKANSGATPKGNIVLCGIGVLFLVVLY